MTAQREWTLDVVDSGLDLPGWLFVPQGLSGQERKDWIDSVALEIEATPGWDGEPVSRAEAREILETGLALRDDSDALAMFQILPAVGGETVNCFINVLPSDELLNWQDLGLVHPADSPHLGSGRQISTHRTVEVEGDYIEVAGVHFAFDNGEVTFLASLDENLTPLISSSLPGLVALVQNIRLLDADGRPFVGVNQAMENDDESWPFEGES